jgi:hypothetical protein
LRSAASRCRNDHPQQGYYYLRISTKGWGIFVFTHSGTRGFQESIGVGKLERDLIGFDDITEQNKSVIRGRVEQFFQVRDCDAVIFVDPNGFISPTELDYMLRKHEYFMKIAPIKLFLSHKGTDKPLIREYMKTLKELGFSPWLDEDAMSAGVELERGILQGFEESCAAIFFVTPNYKDENYLATEINYAISQKRKKGDKFAIVTLVLEANGEKGKVPELLHQYVWKEPKTDLEVIREIVKAIPIKLGEAFWKQ